MKGAEEEGMSNGKEQERETSLGARPQTQQELVHYRGNAQQASEEGARVQRLRRVLKRSRWFNREEGQE